MQHSMQHVAQHVASNVAPCEGTLSSTVIIATSGSKASAQVYFSGLQLHTLFDKLHSLLETIQVMLTIILELC